MILKNIREMTLFTAEKRQFKRERSFKKKRTQLFGNGKDAMSVRNFDDFKRHRYSAVNGTLITTGRTKTAFATKRDKFKVAAVSAAIHGATKRRITAIKHVTLIKVDILKKIATYFNVTTDYLLGVSDVKRDLQRQMKMNETLDEYYDLIEIYKDLDSYDKEMIWSIMQTVKKVGEKRKKDNKLIEES